MTETLEVSSSLKGLGPVMECNSPDVCAAWLRETILTGETFSLSQMERAREWARLVGETDASGIGERDALIIVDFVNATRTPSMLRLATSRVKLLEQALDSDVTSADELKVAATDWARQSRRYVRVDDEMTRVIGKYVYLSRRWPR